MYKIHDTNYDRSYISNIEISKCDLADLRIFIISPIN